MTVGLDRPNFLYSVSLSLSSPTPKASSFDGINSVLAKSPLLSIIPQEFPFFTRPITAWTARRSVTICVAVLEYIVTIRVASSPLVRHGVITAKRRLLPLNSPKTLALGRSQSRTRSSLP